MKDRIDMLLEKGRNMTENAITGSDIRNEITEALQAQQNEHLLSEIARLKRQHVEDLTLVATADMRHRGDRACIDQLTEEIARLRRRRWWQR